MWYLNNYDPSFLLGFLELFKSNLYSLLDILSSLGSIESWSLEFLLISIGALSSSFLCKIGCFSDLSMDFFIKFFYWSNSSSLKGLIPSAELKISFITSFKFFHVSVNMTSQDSASKGFTLLFIRFFSSWESVIRVRDIESTIWCTFHNSEDFSSSLGSSKTGI